MSPPPMPFDDGKNDGHDRHGDDDQGGDVKNDRHDRDRHDARRVDEGDRSGERTRDRRPATGERRPNYLARRAIAVGVVVAVLAAGSVVVGRIIGVGGSGDGAEASGADWNTVVVVADGEVRLVDPATGDVSATYPGDEALLDVDSLTTGHTLVMINEFGRITELDLTDGSIRRTSAAAGSVMLASGEHPSIVLAGPPEGGEVTVVDTPAGATFDIGEVAGLTDPLMFVTDVLVNRSGSHVATADARTFQSVVVDVETRAPVLLAGQVVAMDDTTVATALRAGARAQLQFYDLQGEPKGSADVLSPQVLMFTPSSTALFVAADGAIVSVTTAGRVAELGAIPAADGGASPIDVRSGVATLHAQRLLVSTADEVVLLDTDGSVLARAPGELLTPTTQFSQCALIGSARPTGTAVHIDLETGSVLGEVAGGLVGSASADGCTAALVGGDARVVASGAELDLGAVTTASITVAPDGSAYVVSTPGSDLLVVRDDRAEGDVDAPPPPVALAEEPVLVRFAEV